MLVVDDDDGMRLLVRLTLHQAGRGIVVVGEASSGEEALERWRQLRPDVVIIDYRLPGMDGLEIARRVLAENPGQAIILFTAFRDEGVTASARALGLRACVHKSDLRALPAEVLLA